MKSLIIYTMSIIVFAGALLEKDQNFQRLFWMAGMIVLAIGVSAIEGKRK